MSGAVFNARCPCGSDAPDILDVPPGIREPDRVAPGLLACRSCTAIWFGDTTDAHLGCGSCDRRVASCGAPVVYGVTTDLTQELGSPTICPACGARTLTIEFGGIWD